MADLGRSFPGNTTVYRNRWIKLRFGFPRVKLESPDFEKQFDVYGNDPVEARYLLTPLLMERILQLDQRFGEGLTMSFRTTSSSSPSPTRSTTSKPLSGSPSPIVPASNANGVPYPIYAASSRPCNPASETDPPLPSNPTPLFQHSFPLTIAGFAFP